MGRSFDASAYEVELYKAQRHHYCLSFEVVERPACPGCRNNMYTLANPQEGNDRFGLPAVSGKVASRWLSAQTLVGLPIGVAVELSDACVVHRHVEGELKPAVESVCSILRFCPPRGG